MMESQEKRTVEKPRLPRTAKKLNVKRMAAEMGELGLEIEDGEDVCFFIFTLHIKSADLDTVVSLLSNHTYYTENVA